MTSDKPPKHPWTVAIDEAVDRYHDVLTAYVARGGEDHLALVERMVARGAVFAGRPLCTFLRPNFVLRPQYMQLRRAVEHFRSAVIKTKDTVLRDPQLLDLLALTDGERRLFSYNPAFESVGVVTRLDAILSGPEFLGVLGDDAGLRDRRIGKIHRSASRVTFCECGAAATLSTALARCLRPAIRAG